MPRPYCLMLAAAGSLLTTPALSQDIGGVFDMGVMTGTAAMDPVIEQSREMSIRKGQGDPLPGRSAARPDTRQLGRAFAVAGQPARRSGAADAAALTYRPSAAVRKANFARFVDRTRQTDAAGAARLEQALKGPVIEKADAMMKPHGLTTSNVADSVAVYLVTAWFAARGQVEDATPVQVYAVKGQLASAMNATGGFRSASDAQKQELAEASVIQTILMGQSVEMALKHPEMMEAVKQSAAGGAKNSFGLDLRTMDLTDAGLR